MRLFGFNIERSKTQVVPAEAVPEASGELVTDAKTQLVPAVNTSSFLATIRESFAGAWQKNIVVENDKNLLAFSAVYACVSLIANDIAKLRIKLVEQTKDGIWVEVTRTSPFAAVLRKPNRYQTRIQFLLHWMISLLMYGNTYVIKERDSRGIVIAMYILDPSKVVPLVGDDGSVYYQLYKDELPGIQEAIVEAKEIIHDRINTLWHPLVGVSPIYACAASATQGIRIQANSAKFFENMSRPSGQLTSPGTISDVTAKRLKTEFEANFSGANIGRLLVTGDGLKYEPMTIPANDAQLIEQLRWTVEDVCRCFHVPLYKIGGPQPALSNVGALNQDYYSQTLQAPIESMEVLLDEGLALPTNLGVELELEGLLRMDPLSRAAANAQRIGAGYLAPNEARLTDNLPPVVGGDSPFLQQQNYSLAALAKRDAQADPFAAPGGPAPGGPALGAAPELPAPKPPAEPSTPPDEGEGEEKNVGSEQLIHALITRFVEATHA